MIISRYGFFIPYKNTRNFQKLKDLHWFFAEEIDRDVCLFFVKKWQFVCIFKNSV